MQQQKIFKCNEEKYKIFSFTKNEILTMNINTFRENRHIGKRLNTLKTLNWNFIKY